MERYQSIISIQEIQTLFEEYTKAMGKKYNKDNFQAFLRFLEIDFYDWVRENLRQFNLQK